MIEYYQSVINSQLQRPNKLFSEKSSDQESEVEAIQSKIIANIIVVGYGILLYLKIYWVFLVKI